MSRISKESITFFITTQCNLQCKYCYVTDRTSLKAQTLPLNFARLGLEDYFRRTSCRHIRFFGAGEPSLELDLMEEIRKYAVQIADSDIRVEIQTNGVVSESAAEWLARHVDIIWVSCDGTPELHDHYRITNTGRRTSDYVEDTIRYLVREAKGMVGVRVTITGRSVKRQLEIIEYLLGLGIECVWSDPIFPGVGRKTAIDEVDMMTYAREFLKANEVAAASGMFYGSILTCDFDEETEYHCRACIPVPHLTTDGYISACDLAYLGEVKGPMSVFIYGKWDRENNKIEYYEEKIAALRRRSVNRMPECWDCPSKFHCAGYCPGEGVNETGSLYKPKTSVCEAIRFLDQHLPPERKTYRYMHP